MMHLGLGLSLTGGSAPAGPDYGTAIANISGGTVAQDPVAGDYVLTKTAADGYDTADWNSAAITGAYTVTAHPNATTGRYTRLGVNINATGRSSADGVAGDIHMFFDEFRVVRILSGGAVIWQNGSGNAEPNFTDDEEWKLIRDGSGVMTVTRGGASVASANAVMPSDTGTRYFYASVYYQGESCHAKLT